MQPLSFFVALKVWTLKHRTPQEKNLWAILILVIGLLMGSLLVDLTQVFTGAGFSGHALRNQNLVEMQGKTWVAYTEPRVGLQVVSDSQCADCNPDEALVWLRRIVPTVDAARVEANSAVGKKLIQDYKILTLPAFIFERNVTRTDFYSQAEALFNAANNHFTFDMTKIGLPVGKYLEAPPILDTDVQIGAADAPVKIIVFSDFDCQYCHAYHTVMKHIVADFGDKVLFVFKQLPLPSHPQAPTAALAALCANEQGKFMDYADILFANQADWDKTTGTSRFKSYAYRVSGMNTFAFGSCLDAKKYSSTLETDLQNAQDWNITAAPATFLNTEFVSGAAPYPDVKAILQKQLDQ